MALVVFLRGVNVGGHRTFRPSALAKQLKHLDVVNVGAAGTFVVRQSLTQAELRAELARRLPFDAQIAICRGREIVSLLSNDPFAREPEQPGVVRFVSVLSGPTRRTPALPISLPTAGERLVRVIGREGRFVFGVYRRHMRVISCLGSLDRLFGVPLTTRNWNTMTTIAGVLAASGKNTRKAG